MILKRLFSDQLAQASYLIACDHARVALVVDPNRNADAYIAAAAAEGVRITHVTETHIHADFVSGARELASRTGARLLLSDANGADWRYRYAAEAGAELLTDGSHFMVGDLRIETLHTPGHTPEHISFLVTDTAVGPEPIGVLTGDFVFVGDVGRPDLLERAAGHSGTMDAAARTLFTSLTEFKKLPDYLQIWPGHGAGSACGKALGAMPQSTLGYEKLYNWAMAESDEGSFVEKALTGQPEPPAYFARMKQINRDGPPLLGMMEPPPAITARDLAARIGEGQTVVDTRSASEYAARHIAGTINIPRNKSFLTWAGALLPYERDLYLIVDGDDAQRMAVARELSLVGLERINGVLPSSSLGLLADSGAELRAIPQMTVGELVASRGAVILDVRARTEWEAGHLPGAIHIPLGALQARISELPPGDVVVQCQGGGRSAIAASILELNGRTNVSNLTGGFAEWSRAGNPVERDAFSGRS